MFSASVQFTFVLAILMMCACHKSAPDIFLKLSLNEQQRLIGSLSFSESVDIYERLMTLDQENFVKQEKIIRLMQSDLAEKRKSLTFKEFLLSKLVAPNLNSQKRVALSLLIQKAGLPLLPIGQQHIDESFIGEILHKVPLDQVVDIHEVSMMKKERFTYLFEALLLEKNAESVPLLVRRFLQSQSEEKQLYTLRLLDRIARGNGIKELPKELEIKISVMRDEGIKRQAVSILQDLRMREEYYQFSASYQESSAMMTGFSRFPVDKQVALNFQAIMSEPWEDGIFSGEIAKHGSQILPLLITALLLDDEVGQKSRCILNILQDMAWSGYLCKRPDILEIVKVRVKLASPGDRESLERYHSSIVVAINRKCSPVSANN